MSGAEVDFLKRRRMECYDWFTRLSLMFLLLQISLNIDICSNSHLTQGWKCFRTFQALKWLNYTNILLLIHEIIGTLFSINNQTEIFPVGFVVVNELILLIFICK